MNMNIARVAIMCYAFRGKGKGLINMQSTYARPVRDLRNNYSEILELANQGNQVIITRGGREAAVVIGAAQFRDYEAYVHRMYINEALANAKKQAQDPTTPWLTEDEFWADEMITNIREHWAELDNEQRLQFAQQFIKKIVAEKTGREVTVTELLFNEF